MNDSNGADASVAKRYESEHAALQARLTLWAVLGNVGGLVAAGSVFVSSEAIAAALLFPALWAFSMGAVAGTILNLAIWSSYADIISGFGKHGSVVRPGDSTTILIGLSAVVAGGGFIFGILYPMTGLSLRYLATGAF